MRKIIALATIGLFAALTVPALASSDDDDVSCRTAGGQKMSVQDITAKVSGMGYTVRKVEHDDGCYEVKATDSNGVRIELKLNPATGAIIKSEKRS
ncbi:MAG: PepSY domain-containing protein [Alphaproteobacteria bacterium]|nr:PepSY domain-containing protein [Alphaproteobacteria bacterium]